MSEEPGISPPSWKPAYNESESAPSPAVQEEEMAESVPKTTVAAKTPNRARSSSPKKTTSVNRPPWRSASGPVKYKHEDDEDSVPYQVVKKKDGRQILKKVIRKLVIVDGRGRCDCCRRCSSDQLSSSQSAPVSVGRCSGMTDRMRNDFAMKVRTAGKDTDTLNSVKGRDENWPMGNTSTMSGQSEMAGRVRKNQAMKLRPKKKAGKGEADPTEDTLVLVPDREEHWTDDDPEKESGWCGYLIGKTAEYVTIAGVTMLIVTIIQRSKK